MKTEIKNAIITGTTLDIGDRGFLQGWIQLDYGGACQGFGGYALYLPKSFKHAPEQKNYAGCWIQRIMEIAGVGEWKELVGKSIRVQLEDNMISGIGHILKDEWFFPKIEFKSL